MANKIRYTAKENKKVGTHSFYAVPVLNGKLDTDTLLEEALDGKSIEPSVAKAALRRGLFMFYNIRREDFWRKICTIENFFRTLQCLN